MEPFEVVTFFDTKYNSTYLDYSQNYVFVLNFFRVLTET